MKVAAFWGKILFILSVSAATFLFFDFQIVPMLMRVVRNAQADQKVKLAEVPIPDAVAFEAWDDGADLEEQIKDAEGAESSNDSNRVKPTSGAVVTITSQPIGASVMFNQKLVGTTPFEGALSVAEETHIALSLPGYFPESRTVKPSSSRRLKFVFQLKPLEAAVAPKMHMKSVSNEVPHTTDSLVDMDLTVDSEVPAEDVGLKKVKVPEENPFQETKTPEPTKPIKETQRQLKGKLALDEDEFFTVQVESVKDYKDASFKVALYQAMGFPAYVCNAELADKGTWYRVRLGQFSKKLEAQKLASQVAKQTATVPWVVQEDGLCPKLISATPWETP